MADLSSYINIAANGITTLQNITPSASASPAPSINGFSITNSAGISGNGNIAGGNISATGNVSGNFFLGNGSQLTGISATSLVNGTSNVVTTNNGNVTIGIAGNASIATFTGTGANITGTLNATGNVTAQGTGSNIIRRAFGLVAADTTVTLDDLQVSVTSSTNQLSLQLTTGSWQGTGWTETFTGGTPSVSTWINLPLSSGFSSASGAMNSQGNGCRCIISDQTPSAKVYQITVVRSGTTGAQWNISVERLV